MLEAKNQKIKSTKVGSKNNFDYYRDFFARWPNLKENIFLLGPLLSKFVTISAMQIFFSRFDAY